MSRASRFSRSLARLASGKFQLVSSPVGPIQGCDRNKVLFYSILFYSILFYSILFYSILLYSILFYYILFYSILFYSILFYYIILYSILFYSILFYSILFYSILFYSILFYNLSSYTSIFTILISSGAPRIRFRTSVKYGLRVAESEMKELNYRCWLTDCDATSE